MCASRSNADQPATTVAARATEPCDGNELFVASYVRLALPCEPDRVAPAREHRGMSDRRP
jgi:hypothetical protein